MDSVGAGSLASCADSRLYCRLCKGQFCFFPKIWVIGVHIHDYIWTPIRKMISLMMSFRTKHYTFYVIVLYTSTYAGIPGTMTLQIALRPAINTPDNIVFASLSHKTIFPRASSKIVSALAALGSAPSMSLTQAWTKSVTPRALVIWPLTTELIAGSTACWQRACSTC